MEGLFLACFYILMGFFILVIIGGTLGTWMETSKDLTSELLFLVIFIFAIKGAFTYYDKSKEETTRARSAKDVR